MRLLVVGAGATGGYFGGRLAQAGRDVTFVVRPERSAKLLSTGIRIQSPHGDFHFNPKVVTAAALREPYDAVLVAVKAYSLAAAMEDFAPAVGPATMILPVQNGMRHVDVLSARFGAEPVVGCVCRIVADMDEDGNILHTSKFHSLVYGELNEAVTPRIERLDSYMRGAGFDASTSLGITREMWEKGVQLATLGAVTCLMRGSIGEIMSVDDGPQLINGLLDEVVAVVRGVGGAPSEEALSKSRAALTAGGSGYTSSMYRDMQKGGPIEAAQIIGDLLSRAENANIHAPLLSLAFAHMNVYECCRLARNDA